MHLEWAPSHYTTKYRSPTTDRNASSANLCSSPSWRIDHSKWIITEAWRRFAHGGYWNCSHTNSTSLSCPLCCQERSKSGQVFWWHRNRRWVVDLPLRSSQPVGSQGLEEATWTKTNSTATRKISWKDYEDDFLW